MEIILSMEKTASEVEDGGKKKINRVKATYSQSLIQKVHFKNPKSLSRNI